jgi:glycosyltransferase involved in cell wall biosynthesis
MFNELATISNTSVDIVVPKSWKSNLIKNLEYKKNINTDANFRAIYPLDVFYKGNASFFIFNILKLIKILRANKYDRIFLAQETWSLCLLFLNICKLFTVNRSTSIDLWVCQNIKKDHLYWMRFFERVNTYQVKNILHCCDEIRNVIRWKKITNNCLYFPFSFNPKKYLENYELKNKERKEDITLGHLGRLSEEKGISQLLKTVEELQQVNPNIKFVIAGGGVLENDVKSFCDQSPNRKFLGILEHSKAHLFYREIDVFLLTSQTRDFWKEQFGRVIIEAAASGCSFVGSNSGAIPEVMSKMELPFVYNESSDDDLKSKIDYAMKELQQDNYNQLQDKRHKLAMKNFSHKAVASLYHSYLDKNNE